MEVAGLVLTILPLCIKGVLDLNDGSHELKNYRRTMKDLATQLDVEMNKLQNTFRRLLGGLPFIYPGQLSILVSGEGWDNSVRKHLADHLGVYSTRIFESHMRTLNLLVIELASEFGLDVNSFKPLLDGHDKTRVGLWIKIRHLRKKGDCLTSLTRFREINQDLVGLSGQQSAPPCAVGERSRKLQKLPNAYQSIRDYAINLQEVFREELPSLTCKCEGASAHSVNMRLQTVKDKGGQHLDTGSLKYVVYFSFEMNTATIARLPWDWRDPEAPPETQYVYAAPPTLAMAVQLQTTKLKLPITAEESKKKNPKGVLSKLKSSYSGYSIAHAKSAIKKDKNTVKQTRFTIMDTSGFHEFESIQKPPPPDISFTHEVQNLCSKFDGSGQCHEFCLGSLDCANGTWNIMKRDRIPPVIPFTISTVSLDLLLERRMLEEVARLELGVQLASAVLQLHSTAWMNENWGCQDILFSVDPKIQRQTTDAKVSYPVPIIEKPFVRCAFGSTVTSCTSVFNKLQHKAMSELIDYDKTLFSLGAVLIELWLGRTFEVLKTRDDTAWVESRKLINTMYDSDAGNNYVSAVEQCFGQRRAAWDVKPIPRNLKNEDFKKEVCSTVISVLEENLQRYKNLNIID